MDIGATAQGSAKQTGRMRWLLPASQIYRRIASRGCRMTLPQGSYWRPCWCRSASPMLSRRACRASTASPDHRAAIGLCGVRSQSHSGPWPGFLTRPRSTSASSYRYPAAIQGARLLWAACWRWSRERFASWRGLDGLDLSPSYSEADPLRLHERDRIDRPGQPVAQVLSASRSMRMDRCEGYGLSGKRS